MKDKDLASVPSDPSVSNVRSVKESREAHNRVEARPKMQPFRVIDLFVNYRPLLSFVSDLYFGAFLPYATRAKIDSVSSNHKPISLGLCSRRSLLLSFTSLSGSLPLPAQNSLRSPRSPLFFSGLLPFCRLLLPTAAVRHWPVPPGSLALGCGGRRACGSVLGLLCLASSVQEFVGPQSGRQTWATDTILYVSGLALSLPYKKHSIVTLFF